MREKSELINDITDFRSFSQLVVQVDVKFDLIFLLS